MSKIKSGKVNYAIPGPPMTVEEAEQMIKEAEAGKFHSLQTLREKIDKWKAKYSK